MLEVDASILVTALLSTTTIFLCFAGAALLSKRRSYLYLGGMLSAGITGEPHVPSACSGVTGGSLGTRCSLLVKRSLHSFLGRCFTGLREIILEVLVGIDRLCSTKTDFTKLPRRISRLINVDPSSASPVLRCRFSASQCCLRCLC